MHVVTHYHRVNDDDEFDDAKLIGIFSSEAKADDAIAIASRLPGFVDHPQGFRVARFRMNERPAREAVRARWRGTESQ